MHALDIARPDYRPILRCLIMTASVWNNVLTNSCGAWDLGLKCISYGLRDRFHGSLNVMYNPNSGSLTESESPRIHKLTEVRKLPNRK